MQLAELFICGRLIVRLVLVVMFFGSPAMLVGADEVKEAKPERTTAELVTDLKPSIVVISFSGRDGSQEGLGTGFVVSEDGLIATNLHVISEGRPISVQFADGTKRDVIAVQASDRHMDLAVIKVEATGLKPLLLGDADAAKDGQSVVAIGNPRGLKHSVVEGVLSGRREIEGKPMLQIAMPIEQGNSGGPLVDRSGRVLGVISMKSLVTNNLGFAVSVNVLKPLLEKPNPISMSRWLTIGQLNPREWTPLFGANWRQRAGKIAVEGLGQGFGGRSLCLSKTPPPELPYELAVNVKFSPEDGAAGLVFHSDGNDKHYGFYPTNGAFRLSRFDGPDVFQWQVLKEVRSDAYRPNDWNEIKVRVEKDRLRCFINGQQIIESEDDRLTTGQIGLAKFRHTAAEFRGFRVAKELPSLQPNEELTQRITSLLPEISSRHAAGPKLVDQLIGEGAAAGVALREKARELEQQAERLKQLAHDVHVDRVQAELSKLLAKPDQMDLLTATLWIAALDHEELDVASYVRQIEALAADLTKSLPADADDLVKLAALKKFFFEELGFHGGRTNYDSRSNSHLNEVIDDREGLPISVSIVYIDLARRIGLNVVGVGLPSHFVVRHEPAKGDGQLIDVFDGGQNLSRKQAEELVFRMSGRPARDEHFVTAKPRDILSRVLSNLLGRARNERDAEAMYRYSDTLLTLDPDNPDHRANRFEICVFTKRNEQALADADWLLEKRPEGANLTRIESLRDRLKAESSK